MSKLTTLQLQPPRQPVHHGLERFPTVVWELILGELTNLEDIQNLLAASKIPRSLLTESKWATLYFPLVLPILHKSKDFTQSDFLTLRLVCKSWKNHISHYYQNDPVNFNLCYPPSRAKYRRDKFMNMFGEESDDLRVFLEPSNIQMFMEHFRGTHEVANSVNPFLNRVVHFDVTWQNGGDEMLNEITNLLQVYGIHIWSIHLSLMISITEDVYLRLNNWLQMTPNLKVLHIRTWTRFCEERYNQIHDVINRRPLPKLENLKVLVVKTDLPYPILNELLQKSSSSLEKLSITISGKYVFTADTFTNIRLEKLREVKQSIDSVVQFEAMGHAWWPSVSKICLQFRNRSTYISWDRVFTVLNRFSSGLTHVILTMPEVSTGEQAQSCYEVSRNFPLNLPHLQEFDLTSNTLSSLDFLLPAKHLSKLSLSITFRHAHVDWTSLDSEEVQFNDSFHHRLQFSNIWKHFRNLRQVNLQLLTEAGLKVKMHEKDTTETESTTPSSQHRRIVENHFWRYKRPSGFKNV